MNKDIFTNFSYFFNNFNYDIGLFFYFKNSGEKLLKVMTKDRKNTVLKFGRFNY